jgi:PAS domain S-box-containing protein
VIALIALLAAAGAATAALSPGRSGPWLALAPLAAALVVAGSLQVEFRYGDDVQAVDLFEAVLAPVLYLFAGPAAVIATVVAKAVSQRRLGVSPVKAAFNVAQWAATAGAASLVYRQLARGTEGRPGSLGALVLALVTAGVVNELAMIAVLRIVRAVPLRSLLADLRPGFLPSAVVWAVTVAFGVLLAAAVGAAPAIGALVLAPLLFLHWGHRAYVALHADHARLGGLHRAAHALATPIDPREGIATFADEVRIAFDSTAVEVVLFAEVIVERSGPAPIGGNAVSVELASQLMDGAAARVVTAASAPPALAAALLAAGRHDALAAPIIRHGETVGALCSYDRVGFEGFEEGEDAVLRALADVLARALEKSDLLGTVVDERRKLVEIVDRSSDGIFTLGLGGVVATWNPAMATITGYPAAEMIGAPTFAALRPRDGDGEPVWLERWEDGRTLTPELRVVTREGVERWLACSYAVTDDTSALIVVARDVTRAREIERLKDDFVATVSHELRTPLTAITGFTTLLLDPAGASLPDETKAEALSRIRRSAHRLERLVLNLLEVTRIEARHDTMPNTVEVDVDSIIRRVVDEVTESWPERHVVVTGSDRGLRAAGNVLSIERVLINVLSNAMTYAHEGDVFIDVDGGSREDDDDAVVVTIRDSGPGIAPLAQQRVFERFERFDTADQQAGTGLGLYIARQLAENMGASLTLSSTVGQGCAFSLHLPPPSAQILDLTRISRASAAS